MPGIIQEPSGSCRTSGGAESCSSATSPTISSIRSSKVTIPAVPPYSSSTMAICRLALRSCTSSVSKCTVSGTKITGVLFSPTSLPFRLSRGMAMMVLTWQTPLISSEEPSVTGKREYPVSLASSMTSWTCAVCSMVCIWMRGVMTSAAERSEKRTVRSTNSAASLSSVPISALRRTRETNSAGERAPEISSLTSRPKRCRTLLEKPLSTMMAGLKMAVKISCGRATARPMSKALAMARFLGTSSPMTIESSVASNMATTRLIGTAESPSPSASSGSWRSFPTEGSMT